MSKKTPKFAAWNPASKRVTRLVARALREKERGSAHYDKSREALQKAISAGLMVDQQIEVTIFGADGRPQQAKFSLVDNFVGEAAYRAARVPHYELKRVPKKQEINEPQTAPTAEVGV